MPSLFELKKQRHHALSKAEGIVAAAEAAGRELNDAESLDWNTSMAAVNGLNPQIAALEKNNTMRSNFPSGQVLTDGRRPLTGASSSQPDSPEYARSLHSFLASGGKAHTEDLLIGADGSGGYHVPGSERYTLQRGANGYIPKAGAATYEGSQGGSGSSGGFAINVPTVQQIVPIAMPDLGIFDCATVVVTQSDQKIPQQVSLGTSTLKSESGATIATFGGSDPTLGQIALTSYMAGALRLASFELLQDADFFQQFIVEDLLKSQRILEGSLLANGSGTNQPQGIFGNTGTGVGTPYQLLGTSADPQTLINALFDVTSTLKGQYQPGASWIMSRATGLAIRKAQMQLNLFSQVITTDADGTERIFGRPVFYDVNAPALPTSTSSGVVPILFGDFKAAYIIGVRGGAGINVKVLDQNWASQGQIGIMAYRRMDARVRLAEAVQAVKISHN